MADIVDTIRREITRLATVTRRATVRAVADDGTLVLDFGGGGVVEGVAALASSSLRAGDTVLTSMAPGVATVLGRLGAADITVSSSTPPDPGPGDPAWRSVAAMWVRDDGRLWIVRGPA